MVIKHQNDGGDYMKRFLVVDDEDMGRLMLQEFLAEFSNCDTAANGKEGLLLFEKALADGVPYDLLCVDIIMPEMNGLALVRKIREIEQSHPVFTDLHTKIFVISSSDSAWDKADFLLDNLCDDYIVKPFSRTDLMAKLRAIELIES
jgi:two-component system chemotaxis response regulator CheY